MRNIKKYISLAVAVLMLLHLAASGAAAARLVRVPTAWMDEFETFLIWYAKDRGWDKEVGLDIEIRQYYSGEEMLDAQPTGAWVYAGMGSVPAIMGNLRNNVIAIATGVDESAPLRASKAGTRTTPTFLAARTPCAAKPFWFQT